jgi:hypothetical protein
MTIDECGLSAVAALPMQMARKPLTKNAFEYNMIIQLLLTQFENEFLEDFRHFVAFAVLALEELVGSFGVAADELLRLRVDGQ